MYAFVPGQSLFFCAGRFLPGCPERFFYGIINPVAVFPADSDLPYLLNLLLDRGPINMLTDKKISLIGTGNMGEALLSGLVCSGSSRPENITGSNIR